MNFLDCVMLCARNKGFVDGLVRLGVISLPKGGIEAMVDEATGFADEQAAAFVNAVWDLVWTRMERL